MADVVKVATRDAYGKALVELGEKNDKVIELDADLAKATKTINFKNAFPDRFFDSGIAESNMMGVAAGLAAVGYTVFASSFAMFAAGRAFEQIRNSIGYPHLNVKPADDVEARLAVLAAAELDGPVYLRFGRLAVPRVFDETYRFEIGKGNVLRQGNDVAIIATGLMVAEALAAAETLAAQGVNARVINMATIKPIDKELVIAAAKETGVIVTVEEHSIIGGLGSAVAETVCEACPVPVIRVGVEDKFGASGPAVEMLKIYGLCAENIVEKTKAALALK